MGDKRTSEMEVSRQVKAVLDRSLSDDYVVHIGKSILYKIQVSAQGSVTPDSVNSPLRGQFAFQTDVLIEKRTPSIPLVVIELKSGSFSSHDVITYSAKAARHKAIYPYLRYGFVVVGVEALGRRFVTHNEEFDFAMAVPDLPSAEQELISTIQRQIKSAECLSGLMESNRLKLTRYEENVEVTA